MRSKERQSHEDEWEGAEEALKAAQQMSAGPKRIAALKRAGQMRFDAYEKKRAVLGSMEKETSGCGATVHASNGLEGERPFVETATTTPRSYLLHHPQPMPLLLPLNG